MKKRTAILSATLLSVLLAFISITVVKYNSYIDVYSQIHNHALFDYTVNVLLTNTESIANINNSYTATDFPEIEVQSITDSFPDTLEYIRTSLKEYPDKDARPENINTDIDGYLREIKITLKNESEAAVYSAIEKLKQRDDVNDAYPTLKYPIYLFGATEMPAATNVFLYSSRTAQKFEEIL